MDRVNGCPKKWSKDRYGPRPQGVFYAKWEQRLRWYADRLGVEVRSFEAIEIEQVRREYGIK